MKSERTLFGLKHGKTSLEEVSCVSQLVAFVEKATVVEPHFRLLPELLQALQVHLVRFLAEKKTQKIFSAFRKAAIRDSTFFLSDFVYISIICLYTLTGSLY